jgi:hypothetical protein
MRGLCTLCLFLTLGTVGTLRPQSGGSVISINPGDAASAPLLGSWRNGVTHREIYDWCRTVGVVLRDDAPPVINNTAAFVARFGSTLTIEGLARNRFYTFRGDFVQYTRGSSEIPPSILRISVRDSESRSHLIAQLVMKDLVYNTMAAIDLPYENTRNGSIVLFFEEISPVPGLWGIWDALIVEKGTPVPAPLVPSSGGTAPLSPR